MSNQRMSEEAILFCGMNVSMTWKLCPNIYDRWQVSHKAKINSVKCFIHSYQTQPDRLIEIGEEL